MTNAELIERLRSLAKKLERSDFDWGDYVAVLRNSAAALAFAEERAEELETRLEDALGVNMPAGIAKIRDALAAAEKERDEAKAMLAGRQS